MLQGRGLGRVAHRWPKWLVGIGAGAPIGGVLGWGRGVRRLKWPRRRPRWILPRLGYAKFRHPNRRAELFFHLGSGVGGGPGRKGLRRRLGQSCRSPLGSSGGEDFPPS